MRSLYHLIPQCEALVIIFHGGMVYLRSTMYLTAVSGVLAGAVTSVRVLPLVSLRYYNVNMSIDWLLVIQGYRISYMCTYSGKSTSKAQGQHWVVYSESGPG